jgi:uncharacterized protein (TIGR02246 family)
MSTATMTKPTTPAQSTHDEAAIRALISQWSRALEAKDLDALTADYLPDAVLYDVKPPYKTQGPAAIRQTWEACLPCFPKSFKSEHRDLRIAVSGDVAFCFGLHHLVVPDEPNHPATQSWIRVTACYQKVAGQWKVVHEHVSMPFDCTTGRIAPITDPAAV